LGDLVVSGVLSPAIENRNGAPGINCLRALVSAEGSSGSFDRSVHGRSRLADGFAVTDGEERRPERSQGYR